MELLFGRLDGRTASFARHPRPGRALLPRRLPRDPARAPTSSQPRQARTTGRRRSCSRPRRSAARCGCSCARCGGCRRELDWHATIWLRDPGCRAGCVAAAAAARPRAARRSGRRLRGPAPGARATSPWRPRRRRRRRPQLVLRALAGGAVPVAARLPEYEEALREGELGLLFEPRDADHARRTARAAGRRPEADRPVPEADRGVHHASSSGAGPRTSSRSSTREVAGRRHDPDGRPARPQAAGRARPDPRRPAHAHRPLARLRHARSTPCSRRRREVGPRARSPSPTTTRSRARSRRAIGCGDGRRQGDRGRGGQDRRPGRGDRPLHRGEDPARDDASRRRSPRSAARGGWSTCPTPSTGCTPCPTTSTCSTWWRTSTRSRSSTRAWPSRPSTRRPPASRPSTGSWPAPAPTATWPRGSAR